MDRTKNTAIDLHNILFAQLERLSDDELVNDKKALERELNKTHGMCELSDEIMKLAQLQLEAAKLTNGNQVFKEDVPRLLTGQTNERICR